MFCAGLQEYLLCPNGCFSLSVALWCPLSVCLFVSGRHAWAVLQVRVYKRRTELRPCSLGEPLSNLTTGGGEGHRFVSLLALIPTHGCRAGVLFWGNLFDVQICRPAAIRFSFLDSPSPGLGQFSFLCISQRGRTGCDGQLWVGPAFPLLFVFCLVLQPLRLMYTFASMVVPKSDVL